MATNHAPFNFDDLTPISIPVTYNKSQYTLREASGDAACRYRNAVMACTVMSPEGNIIGVRDVASVEPLLVSLCLYDSQGANVPQEIIRTWPGRIVRQLFITARDISELSPEETEESLLKQQSEIAARLSILEKGNPAKNAQDPTIPGSDLPIVSK